MFANNKKVSIRQLNRVIITENIGMVSLFSGHMAGVLKSVTYVWVFVAAMFISMAYLWIALRISDRYGEKLVRSKIYNILTCARFFAMGVMGIYIFSRVVSGLLLQNTSGVVIIAAIGMLCIFIARCDYEARGRMHEILGIITVIPIAIILVTATFKIDFAYAEEQLGQGVGLPDKSTLFMIAVIFFMVSYFEKLIVIRGHYYNTYGNRISLLKAPIVLWGAAIWVFVVCTCIFGKNGNLLKLMDIGGIPGGFLNRQEAIMAVFLVISLTSYISGMFYYIRQNVKNIFIRYVRTPHIVTRRIVSAVILGLIILGAFVMSAEMGQDSTYEEAGIVGVVEIEKWDFVMSMVINESGGKTQILLEIAGYKNENNEYILYETNTIKEAEKQHIEAGKNELDFSHIKAIVLKNISDKEKIVSDLGEDRRFSGNILIFSAKGDTDWEEYASLGDTLENLGKNVEQYKNSCLYMAGISTDNIMKINLSER